MNEVDWICHEGIVEDLAVVDPTFNSGPNYINIIERFTSNNYTGKISL